MFEIEVDTNSMIVDILGEFDGMTPGFIPSLFKDFPEHKYLANGCFSDRAIDDKAFLEGLKPVPFQVIEIQ